MPVAVAGSGMPAVALLLKLQTQIRDKGTTVVRITTSWCRAARDRWRGGDHGRWPRLSAVRCVLLRDAAPRLGSNLGETRIRQRDPHSAERTRIRIVFGGAFFSPPTGKKTEALPKWKLPQTKTFDSHESLPAWRQIVSLQDHRSHTNSKSPRNDPWRRIDPLLLTPACENESSSLSELRAQAAGSAAQACRERPASVRAAGAECARVP